MDNRKSNGPKPDPCGIPQITLEILDARPMINKNCIAYGQLNMIQTICLLIHIFPNDIIYSTEFYDLQYQKPSEGWKNTTSRKYVLFLSRNLLILWYIIFFHDFISVR